MCKYNFYTFSKDSSCDFHVCEGFLRMYEKAKVNFDEAKRNNQAEPLFIRPSAQWYTCEERKGVGFGFISLTVLPRRQVETRKRSVWCLACLLFYAFIPKRN